jgi:hypothetical protein
MLKFANSWGTDWGANGFGTMSAVDAKKAVTAMWAIDVPPAERYFASPCERADRRAQASGMLNRRS